MNSSNSLLSASLLLPPTSIPDDVDDDLMFPEQLNVPKLLRESSSSNAEELLTTAEPFHDSSNSSSSKTRPYRSLSDSLTGFTQAPPPPRNLDGISKMSQKGHTRAPATAAADESEIYLMDQIIHTGWLVKQGHFWKSWKKRYFVLQTRINARTGKKFGVLQYYRNNKFGKLKGEIFLTGVSVNVQFLDIQKARRPHCFEVVKGFYSLVCQGRDERDAQTWVDNIRAVTTDEDQHDDIMFLSLTGSRARAMSTGDIGQTVVGLVKKMLENPKGVEGRAKAEFCRSFDARQPDALATVFDFITRTRTSIIQRHSEQLMKVLKLKDSDRKEASQSLSRIVGRQIEECVFLPLHDRIYAAVRRKVSLGDEEILNKRMRWLRGKNQSFFGIPLAQISYGNWSCPISVLAQMGGYSLPSDKLEALLNTVVAIQETFKTEHRRTDEALPLSTDDLIPIFTYIVVHSGVNNLLTLRALLLKVCEFEFQERSVDYRFHFQILDAAIECIKSVHIPADIKDIFNEQVSVTVDGDWKRGIKFEEESYYRCGASVKRLTSQGQTALGHLVGKGYVLVAISGTSVVLWTFCDTIDYLEASNPPHHLSFISSSQYFRILGSNRLLWNNALLRAARLGRYNLAQMLVKKGEADVNAKDADGNFVVHFAARNLHAKVLLFLIQHGASVTSAGQFGKTPLHLVGIQGADPESTPTDSVKITISTLLQHGAVIDDVDIDGFTPLMLQAKHGALEGVNALLQAKPLVDVRSWRFGLTALAIAAEEGQETVLRALLGHGANPNIPNLKKHTPLHLASRRANVSICKLLLHHKAEVNVKCKDGLTPLNMAVSRGSLNIQRSRDTSTHVDIASVIQTIRILIDYGADVNATCRMFRAPLHYAVVYGSADIVRELLAHGADSQARDINGYTPLELVSTFVNGTNDAIDKERDSIRDILEAKHGRILPASSSLGPINSNMKCSIVIEENEDGRELIQAATAYDIIQKICEPSYYSLIDAEALAFGIGKCFPINQIIMAVNDRVAALSQANVPTKVIHYRCILAVLDAWVNSAKFELEVDRGSLSEITDFILQTTSQACELDNDLSAWVETSYLGQFLASRKSEEAHGRFLASVCSSEYTELVQFVQILERNSNGSAHTDPVKEAAEIERRTKRMSLAGVLDECDSPGSDKSKHILQPSLSRRFWQLGLDPVGLAAQMTILQHYYFQEIPLNCFLINRKNSPSKVEPYNRAKKLHNHISMWVVNQILLRKDVDARWMVLEYFIHVANACLSPLQNFDGFMAVMNGLNDSSIFRLKLTWARLSHRARELWGELKPLTERGARKLNKRMREADPPAVPYIGLILQNVLGLQEYPDVVENDLINFHKHRCIGEVLLLVRRFQNIPYILPSDLVILDQILAPLGFDEKEICFNRSLELEPRIQ